MPYKCGNEPFVGDLVEIVDRDGCSDIEYNIGTIHIVERIDRRDEENLVYFTEHTGVYDFRCKLIKRVDVTPVTDKKFEGLTNTEDLLL